MSWLQWRGKIWEPTDEEAHMDVYIRASDGGGPKCLWTWHVSHIEKEEPPTKDGRLVFRHLMLEIMNIGLEIADWRELSGREIRSTPQWWTEQEHISEYGKLWLPKVVAHGRASPDHPATAENEDRSWSGHDFHLKFGKRDGAIYATELDAWLMPDEEYYRERPETPEELARLPEGEPTVRILARSRLDKATVHMARCGDDPVPQARKILEEATGFDGWKLESMEWWKMGMSSNREERRAMKPAPGWRSTVKFRAED